MAFTEFNRTLTGSRNATGSYVNSVWVAGASSPLSLKASVQPSSDKELMLLPEGRRSESGYTLRSFSEIIEGDFFTIQGDIHEVLKVQIWQNGIISHYLGVATKVQP